MHGTPAGNGDFRVLTAHTPEPQLWHSGVIGAEVLPAFRRYGSPTASVVVAPRWPCMESASVVGDVTGGSDRSASLESSCV